MFFVFLRSIERHKLILYLEAYDESRDFLGTKENQLIVNIF